MTESFKEWFEKNRFCTADVPPSADVYVGDGCSEDCVSVVSVRALGERCFEEAKESIFFDDEKEKWLIWFGLSEKQQKKILSEIEPVPADGNVSWLFLAYIFLGESEFKKRLKELVNECEP